MLRSPAPKLNNTLSAAFAPIRKGLAKLLRGGALGAGIAVQRFVQGKWQTGRERPLRHGRSLDAATSFPKSKLPVALRGSAKSQGAPALGRPRTHVAQWRMWLRQTTISLPSGGRRWVLAYFDRSRRDRGDAGGSAFSTAGGYRRLIALDDAGTVAAIANRARVHTDSAEARVAA